MRPEPRPERQDSSAVIRLLIYLRYLAVIGQLAAVLFVSRYLGMDIPTAPLYITIAALLAFNLVAHALLRPSERFEMVALVVHLCMDLFALTVLLYFTGGPANPFVSLYLVPVALAAISLRVGAMIAKTVLAAALYTFLLEHHVPMPHPHVGNFDLHVFGMWINFLLCAIIMATVLARFMAIVHEQRRRLAQERERAMRNEALLALGTLAAGTAHELNTPLTTLGLLVDELDRGGHQPDHEDFDTMRTQIGRCRQHVRTLAELARHGALGEARDQSLSDFVDGCIQRWQLLRPGVLVRLNKPPQADAARLKVDPSLPQALINLLDNAADASALASDEPGIEVDINVADDCYSVRILDRGPGPRPADEADERVPRGAGLGIGLLISNASIERNGGRVGQYPREDGGCVTLVTLPAAAA